MVTGKSSKSSWYFVCTLHIFHDSSFLRKSSFWKVTNGEVTNFEFQEIICEFSHSHPPSHDEEVAKCEFQEIICFFSTATPFPPPSHDPWHEHSNHLPPRFTHSATIYLKVRPGWKFIKKRLQTPLPFPSIPHFCFEKDNPTVCERVLKWIIGMVGKGVKK